jgi:hypothetical protein
VQKLVAAFRSACHTNDEKEDDDFRNEYEIANSKIFNRIIIFCLKNMPSIFGNILTKHEGTIKPKKRKLTHGTEGEQQ